jgi:hypothetical protein
MGTLAMAEEIIQGSTRPTLPLAFVKNDGTPVVLTGATITGRMRKQGSSITTDLAGTISVTDGPSGKATLAYDAADVAQFGMFLVQVTAVIAGQTYIAQFLQPIREAL